MDALDFKKNVEQMQMLVKRRQCNTHTKPSTPQAEPSLFDTTRPGPACGVCPASEMTIVLARTVYLEYLEN